MTSALPEPAGVFAVSSVAETNLTSLPLAPIVTVEAAVKPLPLILTGVPPAAGPWEGVIDSTLGGAM